MTGSGAEDAGLLESLLADAAATVSRGEAVWSRTPSLAEALRLVVGRPRASLSPLGVVCKQGNRGVPLRH